MIKEREMLEDVECINIAWEGRFWRYGCDVLGTFEPSNIEYSIG